MKIKNMEDKELIKKFEVKLFKGKTREEFKIKNKITYNKRFIPVSNLKKIKEAELKKEKEDLEIKKALENKKSNSNLLFQSYNQKELSAFDLKTNEIIRELYLKLIPNNNAFMFKPDILKLIKFRDRMKIIRKFFNFTYFPKDNLIKIEIIKMDNEIIDYFNLFEAFY